MLRTCTALYRAVHVLCTAPNRQRENRNGDVLRTRITLYRVMHVLCTAKQKKGYNRARHDSRTHTRPTRSNRKNTPQQRNNGNPTKNGFYNIAHTSRARRAGKPALDFVCFVQAIIFLGVFLVLFRRLLRRLVLACVASVCFGLCAWGGVGESWAFWLVFAVCFVFFLCGGGRLLWR